MNLEQLRALLDALRGDNPEQVTDEQLTEARQWIREQATPDTPLETLRELRDARVAIADTQTARAQAAQEHADLLAEFDEPDEPEDTADTPDDGGDTDQAPDGGAPEPPPADAPTQSAPQPPDPAPGDTPAAPPAAVAASGRRAPVGSMRQQTDKPRRNPALVVSGVTTAAGGTASFEAGAHIDNLAKLGVAMAERVGSLAKSRAADGERLHVARTVATYPEERTLRRSDSFEVNFTKIENVASPEALVAAGGLCAPLETLYDVEVIGSTARPIRDALARFQVERGGIQYRPHSSAASAVNGVGVWTMDDDELAGPDVSDPYKICYRVDCPGLTEAEVQAVYLCLEFSNITSRYDPETTAANVRQGMIAHARLAENQLWAQILATSKILTAGTQEVGAVRHVLAELDKVVAYYRNRHRIDESVRLTCIMPAWARYLFRADLAYQMAAGDWAAALGPADSLISGWFERRGINIVWHLDGGIGGTSEVQTITVTGTPTGGTFTLTYDGETTAAIPYNASAAAVKTALEALPNIMVGDITTGGGPLPGTAVTVTFEAGLNPPEMTASESFTGGSDPAISVSTTTAGSTTATVSGVTIPPQVYDEAAAGAEIPEFPEKIDTALFVTGTKLFLDGGTLDLGVVRDSTLNSRNSYRQFSETFEGVADRGVESLRVVFPAVPAGMSAGTVDLLGS